ncbi:translation initiation factor IF-2-like [Aquila chrysaetos chrysaetos]|uniref:translation initiation factor IF-2-like n=1 Tax=Aquila chrysaetos chrysaetos TaxID=223781 RepID=UPI0011765753|nr:translation initiation factor IF-2-like [Aquila chrysaetos chrysaetos]
MALRAAERAAVLTREPPGRRRPPPPAPRTDGRRDGRTEGRTDGPLPLGPGRSAPLCSEARERVAAGVGESIWLSPAPLSPHTGPGDAEADTDRCTPPPGDGGGAEPTGSGYPPSPCGGAGGTDLPAGLPACPPTAHANPPKPRSGVGGGPWGALGPPSPPPGGPRLSAGVREVKMPALSPAGSEKKNSPTPASHGPPLPRGTGVGHPRAGESAEPEEGGESSPHPRATGTDGTVAPGLPPPPPPRAVHLGWGGWLLLFFIVFCNSPRSVPGWALCRGQAPNPGESRPGCFKEGN